MDSDADMDLSLGSESGDEAPLDESAVEGNNVPVGAAVNEEYNSPSDHDAPLKIPISSHSPSDVGVSTGLMIKEIHKAYNIDGGSEGPSADLVHVAAIRVSENMHSIDQLFGADTKRTETAELIFYVDMTSLLAGDLAEESIEQQAMQLLKVLVSRQIAARSEGGRAIILVAYDLGSLVVKLALTLALRSPQLYPGIIKNTSRIIFSGCPQRAPNRHSMESKLLEFLQDEKDEEWSQFLTLPSIQSLARIVLSTTTKFIESKLTLRKHIVSIYAHVEPSGLLHRAWDYFTATLGVPSEGSIQEQAEGEDKFPLLTKHIAYGIEKLLPRPEVFVVESALVSLAAPHNSCQLDLLPAESLLTSLVYIEWLKPTQLQPLHVYGSSTRTVHGICDQISQVWRQKLIAKKVYEPVTFVFTFDNSDPLRDSISGMVASFILQAMDIYTQETNPDYTVLNILRDWYLFRAGWTEKSHMIMFDTLRNRCFHRDKLFVLKDMDQCSRKSRADFLKYIEQLCDNSEHTFKVVVTSRDPQALEGEFQGFLKLNTDGFVSITDSEDEAMLYHALTRFCVKSAYRNRLEEALTKLKPWNKQNTTKLWLAQEHTGWPDNPSLDCLDQFTCLVELISPEETPMVTLDKMLRSFSEYDQFYWLLGWVICGYRPLSIGELSDLLYHRGKGNGTESGASKRSLTAGYRRQIESWFRVLTEFQHNKIILRHEIRDILNCSSGMEDFTWSNASKTAHQTIVDFCVAYLVSNEAQSSLETISSQVSSAIEQQQQEPWQEATSVIADGESILFYIVQALPYHLANCSSDNRATAVERLIASSGDNPYTLWAKVYWAMTCPLMRTPTPPISTLPMLVGLGILPQEEVNKTSGRLREQCLIAAAGSQNNATFVLEELQRCSGLSEPLLVEILYATIQASNEHLAIELINHIMSLSTNDNNKYTTTMGFPEIAIWTATWLGMGELVTALLSRGVTPDPRDNAATISTLKTLFFPSPLWLACLAGHESLVKILINHGANVDVCGGYKGLTGCFQVAASMGRIEVLEYLVARKPCILESRRPSSGLFCAARSGHWRAVKVLLGLTADPQSAQGCIDMDRPELTPWTPLAVACLLSNPRTTNALLEGGANPNSLGPYGTDTPIWMAVINDPSVDCVRILLKFDADPNHELLSTPLLVTLVYSSVDDDVLIDLADALLGGEKPIDIHKADSRGETALMCASSVGRLTFVRWLLKNGADVNMLDEEENSALLYAIYEEKVDVVKELLQHHPQLHTREGRTPMLHRALKDPEMVRLLLEAGADPDVEDPSGYSLINLAVLAQKEEVVKMLIAKKADLNHLDSYGWPPVLHAVANVKSPSLTRLLVDNGVDLIKPPSSAQFSYGTTLLHYAALGPTDIMRILLEFTKHLKLDAFDDYNRTPLMIGSSKSTAQFDCLKLLILAGADVNAKDNWGECALHEAARSGQDSLFSLLLDQPEIDMNIAGIRGTPLQIACEFQNTLAVRALLDHNANVNQAVPKCLSGTALMSALRPLQTSSSQGGDEVDQLVRELVSRGADVKQAVTGNLFYTALSAACLGASTGTINFLIDEGASADLADPVSGRLPLHFAASNGIENFRAILLAYRGDLMQPDNSGKTCLHWAAQFGNAKTVRFIVSRTRDATLKKRVVSEPDEDGWTPLCWAVRALVLDSSRGIKSETPNHAIVVEILIDNGADPRVECKLTNGETIETLHLLALARRSGAASEILSTLETHLRGSHYDGAERPYVSNKNNCDICLSDILGYRYKCTSCGDYDVCTKCLPNSSKYHNGEIFKDNLPHTFERTSGDEYQDSQARIESSGRT